MNRAALQPRRTLSAALVRSATAAAWRALHLIGPGQHVTAAVYLRRVTDAAIALAQRRPLTTAGFAQYIAQAKQYPNVS